MSENKISKYFEYNEAKVPSIGLGTAFMTSDIAEVGDKLFLIRVYLEKLYLFL